MTRDGVPARTIRAWLHAWMAATGDPANVVAVGFAIDHALLLELVGTEPPRMIPVIVARDLCVRLRIHPDELWKAEIATAIGVCEWQVEPLWTDVPGGRA